VLDPAETDAALALDAETRAAARAAWLRLADIAVFGELRAPAIGALPRLRKRVLDLGERLRALFADRAWIPQPRERLKNALASAIGVRDALAALRAEAAPVDAGADAGALRAELAALDAALAPVLVARANTWATLLARRAGDDDNARGDPP
jgi:hypothetical protein